MPVPRGSLKTSATMYCSISGAIPSDPVISTRSGHLYDRPLIEKILSANGNKCPETGESLTKDDLLSVKSGGIVAPMPPEKSSVPGVLEYVKDEWDTLTIELHNVKKELHKTRKELATALYRYDAAVKVIANLERERDDAQQKLRRRRDDRSKDVRSSSNHNSSENEKEMVKAALTTVKQDRTDTKDSTNDSKLPTGLVELAKKRGEELQTARIAKKSAGVLSAKIVGAFSETGKVAVDGTDTAITCLALRRDTAYAGCTSGKLHCIENMKVSRSISAHDGVVTSIWTGNSDNNILSGGVDGCVRVWDGELVERGKFEAESAVVDVERHEIGMIFCCHKDSFIWRDQDTWASVAKVDVDEEMTCGAIHPDGMVFATGGKGIGMWDLASMKQVARFGERKVIDVAMSEKGYYMICCDEEGAHVWDLRKQKVVGSMKMNGAAGVCVEGSGEYGCVAGNEGVGLFVAKKRATRIGLLDVDSNDGWKGRGGVAWGDTYVLVGGGDGMVRRYSDGSSA